MKHSLTWMCVVGGLLVVEVTEGRALAPRVTVLDKETAAEVRKLQEKRRDILRDALAMRKKLWQQGRIQFDEVVGPSRRLLAAELELAATDAERIAAHERHFETAQALLNLVETMKRVGGGFGTLTLDAKAFSLEAQIGLLKAGGNLKKAKK